jgi:hypothetical protein
MVRSASPGFGARYNLRSLCSCTSKAARFSGFFEHRP